MQLRGRVSKTLLKTIDGIIAATPLDKWRSRHSAAADLRRRVRRACVKEELAERDADRVIRSVEKYMRERVKGISE